MKKHMRLPRSLRKYIRQEKARIRREITDPVEQEKKIAELYRMFFKNSSKSE